MYIVYILYSHKHDKTYVGVTGNLEKRFLSHNSLGTKGWTIHYRPWIIIHTEHFKTKSEALKREKEFKSGKGREYIKEHILKKFI